MKKTYKILLIVAYLTLLDANDLKAFNKVLFKHFINFNPINQLDEKKPDSLNNLECLEITGKFDGTVKDLAGNYTAELILDNMVIASQTINVRRSFLFVLKRDLFYSIRVKKEGYISKTLSVSTKLTGKLDEKNSYVFSFETNLLSQDLYGNFDDDDVDFPVALISYNKSCDCFEHNKEYTASLINRMINNLFFGI